MADWDLSDLGDGTAEHGGALIASDVQNMPAENETRLT